MQERKTIGPEVGLFWPECSFFRRTLACLDFGVGRRKVTGLKEGDSFF